MCHVRAAATPPPRAGVAPSLHTCACADTLTATGVCPAVMGMVLGARAMHLQSSSSENAPPPRVPQTAATTVAGADGGAGAGAGAEAEANAEAEAEAESNAEGNADAKGDAGAASAAAAADTGAAHAHAAPALPVSPAAAAAASQHPHAVSPAHSVAYSEYTDAEGGMSPPPGFSDDVGAPYDLHNAYMDAGRNVVNAAAAAARAAAAAAIAAGPGFGKADSDSNNNSNDGSESHCSALRPPARHVVIGCVPLSHSAEGSSGAGDSVSPVRLERRFSEEDAPPTQHPCSMCGRLTKDMVCMRCSTLVKRVRGLVPVSSTPPPPHPRAVFTLFLTRSVCGCVGMLTPPDADGGGVCSVSRLPGARKWTSSSRKSGLRSKPGCSSPPPRSWTPTQTPTSVPEARTPCRQPSAGRPPWTPRTPPLSRCSTCA